MAKTFIQATIGEEDRVSLRVLGIVRKTTIAKLVEQAVHEFVNQEGIKKEIQDGRQAPKSGNPER